MHNLLTKNGLLNGKEYSHSVQVSRNRPSTKKKGGGGAKCPLFRVRKRLDDRQAEKETE